jgi:two-component system, NtrC family, response regulator AtoC
MTNVASATMLRDATLWMASTNSGMQTIENVIAEIAPTDIPILLVGESGTGKEMYANRVHRLSRYADKPITRIACASITSANLLAELRFDSNGDRAIQPSATVLFDEIHDLDAECQSKLLCALPDGETGARRGMLMARVISTTSRDLDEAMHTGRFRTELYYRLNGVCLRLPALRDRKDDIPMLADYFLAKHATQFGRLKPSLSERTMQTLADYSWPGNIRELENVVKKIVALGDEELAIAEIGSKTIEIKRTRAAAFPGYSLKAAARAASREAERELIMKALTRTRWNRKRAAQELQISYKSLLYKLKQIGLEETPAN